MVVDYSNHLKTFEIIQITLVGKEKLCLGAINEAGVYFRGTLRELDQVCGR
jgi:hypothetical protein